MDFAIVTVTELPKDQLTPLLTEGEQNGWHFVGRLAAEWESEINRFDRVGEVLFVARAEGRIIGVCGLNIDPYLADASVARVRHLYVLQAYRCLGIGRQLVQSVVDAASGRFNTLRLRTANPVAARLYEKLGFRPVKGNSDCTHIIELNIVKQTKSLTPR